MDITKGTAGRYARKGLSAIVPIALTVALALVFSMMVLVPGTAHKAYADGNIGSVSYRASDGTWNTTEFSNYKQLKQYLENQKNKTVKVEMYCDWTKSAGSVTERLKIPSNSITTMNMNGHMIDREMTQNNNSDWDGEVIDVEPGATFTLNGGSTETTHKAYVYTSTSRDAKAGNNPRIDVAGGLITGGASWDGAGGIHIKKGATVTLNDVTIAGCRSQQKDSECGDGGGLCMVGGGSILNLNSTTITGCFAYNDGGGIYADDEGTVLINLKNSHVDANFANSDGGGINPDCIDVTIAGDGASTVSNNACGSRGGGILAYKKGGTISGLELKGNKAGDGGAIYTIGNKNDVKTLVNLVIEGNTATSKGGGIYIQSEGQKLANCTITGNTGRGGGVYVNEDTDEEFTVAGKTIIRENSSNDGSAFKNFYMSDGDAEDSKVVFELEAGSEVWVSYYDGDRDQILVSPADYKNPCCAKYLHSDQDGYYLDYASGKILRKRGHKVEPPDPTMLTEAQMTGASSRTSDGTSAGKVGVVGPGGAYAGDGPQFDKIRMFYSFSSEITAEPDPETYDPNKGDIAVAYYSDGLFYENPKTYNQHLGIASWALAFSGGYQSRDEEPYAYGNITYNKHSAARQFLADIGCPDETIYVNDDNIKAPNEFTIGVAIGSKELAYADGTKTGDILIPVTVRGLGYGDEWVSNVTLGKSGEAYGFSVAAGKVVSAIDYYLDKYKLRDAYRNGHVKFWVTGYSRAGATANLTSKRLVEKIATDCTGDAKSQVFCYTCEAPKGGTDEAEQLDDSSYFCIHNMINRVDIVPYVAPEQMGFKRYGVDHFIPGSNAYSFSNGMIPADWDFRYAYIEETNKPLIKLTRQVKRTGSGTKTVTTYADNLYTSTKTRDYDDQREKMVRHLGAIDDTLGFDDYFHPMAMDFIPSQKVYEKGNYDGNTVEAFVEDFVNFLQVAWLGDSRVDSWYQAVSDRGFYVDGGVQNMAQELMRVAYDENGLAIGDVDMDKFELPIIGYFGEWKIVISEKSQLDLWEDCIDGWTGLTSGEKEEWYDFVWDLVDDAGVFDGLTDVQRTRISFIWETLLDRAFTYATADHSTSPMSSGYIGYINSQGDRTTWAAGSDEETMMYTPTLMNHVDYIISCHLPQVNIAWARSYDSWYANETTLYRLDRSAGTVDAPKAYATSIKTGEKVELVSGESQSNKLIGDQLITFDADDRVGEAIYYRFSDELYDGEKFQYLYRGGFTLAGGSERGDTWTLPAYAMAYGNKSAEARYNITLYDDAHRVNVLKADGTSALEEFTAKDGEKVTLPLPEELADTGYYASWKVECYERDSGGYSWVDKGDVTDKLGITASAARDSLSFTMPASGSDGFPHGYRLEFTVEFGEASDSATVSIAAPVAGQPLQESADVVLPSGATASVPIEWAYLSTSDPDGAYVPASGLAYQDAEYRATFRVPADMDNGVAFADTVAVTAEGGGTFAGGKATGTVERNPWNGGITVSLNFPKTGTEGGSAKPDELFTLQVQPIDLNMGQPGGSPVDYLVEQGSTVTVAAPDVEQERFMYWESDDIAIPEAQKTAQTATLDVPAGLEVGQVLELRACYAPVITKLDVQVAAPVAGEPLAISPEHLRVTVSNEYEIDPAFVELSWLPAPPESADPTQQRTAEYLTKHTAVVKLAPKEDENGPYIMATKIADGEGNAIAGESPVRLNAVFLYSANLQVTASAETEEASARILSVTCDTDQASDTANTVFVTFAASNYELASVMQPGAIGSVPHGTTAAQIEAMLPKSTTVLTTSGLEFEADIEWGTPAQAYETDDARSASTWTAAGTVVLPGIVDNPEHVDLDVSLAIAAAAAEQAATPTSSLKPGDYLYDQTATLAAEEGGTIRYTIDGTEPTAASPVYSGDPIIISRDAANLVDEMVPETTINEETGQPVATGNMIPTGRKAFVIKAFTAAEGKWDSGVVTYTYTFSDIPVPTGAQLEYNGTEQIGVEAGAFYTLSVADDGGARIDENGNAVATDEGTYQVTATLNDGLYWALPESQGGRSQEPQVIEFTISHEHVWGEGPVIGEPTCTEDGTQVLICEACHATKFVKIDALGHSLEPVAAVAPTCTEAGCIAHWRCEVCGALFADDAGEEQLSAADVAVDAIGHKWGAGVVTTEPTIGAEGIMTYTCENDAEHTRVEMIDKVDATSLSKAAVEAMLDAISTRISEDGKDLAPGTEYVTPESDEAFAQAISEAWAVADAPTSTQKQVDDALADLAAARQVFDNSKKKAPEAESIARATVTGIADKAYTGKAQTQNPVVKLDGKTLKAGTDYTLSYKNNVKVGIATVTIAGKAPYTGSVSKQFRIGPTWKRLWGKTAPDTMVKITKEYGTAKTAVVATSADFRDSLAAVALAGSLNAPMLTTAKGSLTAQTKAELKRMGVTTVYIIGGPDRVSYDAGSQIKELPKVNTIKRVAGKSFSARAVSAAKAQPKRSDTVIIATQNNFKDALAISSYAYATKSPVLYPETNKKLSTATVNYIKSAKYKKAIIVGGPKALPTSIETQLRSAGIPAKSITRLAGSNQYRTARVVAEWATGSLKVGTGGGTGLYQYASIKFAPAVKLTANKLGVARADNNKIGWKDALAAAALCGKNKSILLLADAANCTEACAVIKAKRTQISYGYVFGGTSAIPEAVYKKLVAASMPDAPAATTSASTALTINGG